MINHKPTVFLTRGLLTVTSFYFRMSDHPDDDVLVDNDQLDLRLQPHLAIDHDNSPAGLEYVNPVLDESDGAANRTTANNGTGNITQSKNGQSKQNGEQSNGQVSLDTPVVYNARSGETSVVREPVVIRQPNGIHVIRTRACCDNVHDPNRIGRYDRPLKLKRIKFLKAFSVVAVAVFFPLGIPAMYYAFKCEKEFHAGIMRGNIDMAQKMAKRSERFIIFSVMAALLVAVSVFAIVERNLMGNDEEYWQQRSHSGAFPAGK